jgi:hypothetical protein
MPSLEDEITEQLQDGEWKTISELQAGIRKERRVQSKSRTKFTEEEEPQDPEMYRALTGLEHRGLLEQRQRSRSVSEWRRRANGKRRETPPEPVVGPRNRVPDLVPA